MDLENIKKKGIPQEIKSAVNVYLISRAYAKTMRERVDEIQREILRETPLYPDPRWNEGNRKLDIDIITDPKDSYLADLESKEMKDYYTECDKRERAAGLKPEDMPLDNCPACTAEHNVTKAQWLICDVAANWLEMGIDGKALNNRLLCMGMDKYKGFIELIVKCVVNAPGYKNPLN